MPRVKRGSKRIRRRKKILSRTKGYYAGKSKLHRLAKLAMERSLEFAYVGRKRKKRDFRNLWTIRISAGARKEGLSYSKFIGGLKRANIALDRKVLAQIAVEAPETFKKIAEVAKQAR